MRSRTVITLIFASILTGSFLLESCRKTGSVARTTPIRFVVPPGFPQPVYDFQRNPVSQEGFLLGKKLFYDGRLSLDGHFPCASCHQPIAAFTTYEHDRSHGYNNSHTLRNAPGLFNLAWYPAFRQDGSAGSLEALSLAHITAPDEMAETIQGIIKKLQPDTSYQRLFRAAYGSAQITGDRILKALSQFLVSMVSADAKYDRVMKGSESFTPEEQSGYAVFQTHCGSCHKEPLFTDFSYRNVGLPVDPLLNDYGRMMVTGQRTDSLKFRVPSLRNAEFTSYYAHDGRFSLTRHMIQHYRYGVQAAATLDPLVAGGINLTQEEENHLVAFLRTLSDSGFLNNPRYVQ